MYGKKGEKMRNGCSMKMGTRIQPAPLSLYRSSLSCAQIDADSERDVAPRKSQGSGHRCLIESDQKAAKESQKGISGEWGPGN